MNFELIYGSGGLFGVLAIALAVGAVGIFAYFLLIASRAARDEVMGERDDELDV